jgi:hypothetical protein
MARSPYRELAGIDRVRPRPRDARPSRPATLFRVACDDGQIWWLAILLVLIFRGLYYATSSLLLWPWH